MKTTNNKLLKKELCAAPAAVDTEMSGNNEETIVKKRRFKMLRAAVVCLIVFTVLCGVIYPLSVMLVAQTAFPYEANGSQITITMPDGTQKIFGSELIGQSYESPEYLFGRVNTGAPSNLSPESEEYANLLKERIALRKEKLKKIGYVETESIPLELITSSGSGVDPHISPDAAYFQIPVIVAARNAKSVSDANKITEKQVKTVIDKYTEGRFLGIFGEKRVNVLLVNLALEGLL